MKKKAVLVSVSLFSFLLVSCNPFAAADPVYNQNEANKYESGKKTGFKENEKDPFVKGKDYFRSIVENEGMHSGPTYSESGTMEAKMLVVPLVFNEAESKALATEALHSKIETCFFGKAEETSYWESVASFYRKSSYGKLSLSGETAAFYELPYSFETYRNMAAQQGLSSVTGKIARDVYTSLFVKGTYALKDFDSDGDGALDYVHFVYLHASDSSDRTGFAWAFTNWTGAEGGIRNYSWSSYKFMSEGTSAGTDAHTYIHETGHQMGLDDYYSYDLNAVRTANPYYLARSPMGRMDMMDANVGDHDAFSKYLLGWIRPTVGEKGKSYTLKPFEENGDALILASDFNGTCFDEYYLVSYYTPTGLNELDAKTNYAGNEVLSGVKKSGLLVYHVDQRLTKVTYSRDGSMKASSPFYYYDTPTPVSGSYFRVANSNTIAYNLDPNNGAAALVSIVQADGKTNLMTPVNGSMVERTLHKMDGTVASDDLFTAKSYTFNDEIEVQSDEGWTLPFVLSVDSMDDSSAKVTLTEK